ncbi:MAG: signal peptidase II [Fimbriimonadales bacterium]|nr:signal peptidase II [Fimbriimonadales bacterium]MDW8051691.1 signal peptidase II [Armatimonadota bacterium]
MFWRVAAIVLVIDQLTKFWATASLPVDRSVPVVPPYFYLTLTYNTGIAFGLLEGHGWITIPLTLLVVGGLVWYHYRYQPPRRTQLLMGLLLGGALGNFVDRARLGYVVDMFDFVVWPVFNVADIAITISLLGLVAVQFFDVPTSQSPNSGAAEEKPQ